MIKHQMFIAMALLAGVAIGYFVKDDPIPAEEPKAEETAKKSVADKGNEASIKALRRRIAELEKLLAEKGEESEITISNAVAKAAKTSPPEPPRPNWRERIEEMKKNDPERYTEMTNRMTQWRQRRREQARTRIEFLSSIDVSHMGAEARKTHDDLQALIARREELEELLQREDLPDVERSKAFGEMGQMHREMVRLNEAERGNLLEETARGLGFDGEDAKTIAETIQDVIDATNDGWGGGRRRGGPPPGGPGGR